MGSTRQRSDRPDSARRRQFHTPEQLESRLVLSAALPNFLSLYTPSDLYVTNPITNQRIPISARDLMQHNNPNSSILSNQGKIVSGTDRAGDQWTITVHGPGQVIVTDTTPNDGALDDDIATIQIINSSLQSTYVTGTVIASSRVLTAGQVSFDRLIANSGVRSIVLNGFDLSANVTPAVDQTPGIFLYGGVQTLKFNDIDAIIDTASSGNPTVTGSLPSGVSGTVNQAPAITSADDAAFTVGQFGSFTITTTGYPTPAITETGSLPTGVTFTDNGNGTATLAGTPQEGTLGTYPLTLTAANGISPSATQSFTLTVNPQYQIVIGDPSTPLKVKPSIYLDSIINSVFDSTATTIPTTNHDAERALQHQRRRPELQRRFHYAVAHPAQLHCPVTKRDRQGMDRRAAIRSDSSRLPVRVQRGGDDGSDVAPGSRDQPPQCRRQGDQLHGSARHDALRVEPERSEVHPEGDVRRYRRCRRAGCQRADRQAHLQAWAGRPDRRDERHRDRCQHESQPDADDRLSSGHQLRSSARVRRLSGPRAAGRRDHGQEDQVAQGWASQLHDLDRAESQFRP